MSAVLANPFTAPAAAMRYASGRPSTHARVLARLAAWLEGHLPVERALDVGCGTGHSTLALVPYARWIMGVDSSSAMMAQAPVHPQIDYRKGRAETLPFGAAEFDLVTVSSAFHWFDHEGFLAEAARVLRPGGWLVVYRTGSNGKPPDSAEFERWRRDAFHARYPKVNHNEATLPGSRAAGFGFAEVAHETIPYQQVHRLADYAENLMTHSNMIRAIEGGRETADEARAWLRLQLARFFAGGQAELQHEARLQVFRRRAA